MKGVNDLKAKVVARESASACVRACVRVRGQVRVWGREKIQSISKASGGGKEKAHTRLCERPDSIKFFPTRVFKKMFLTGLKHSFIQFLKAYLSLWLMHKKCSYKL